MNHRNFVPAIGLFALTFLIGATVPAAAQVTRTVYQPTPIRVTPNAPNGLTISIPVTAEGRIPPVHIPSDGQVQFTWFPEEPTVGCDLRIRYTLPDGTFFEQEKGRPPVSVAHLVNKVATGTWKLKITERNASCPPYDLSTGFTAVVKRDANPNLPVTGPSVAALSGADSIVLDWLRGNQFESGVLAVMKQGRLVYTRGYGWQDRGRTQATLPHAVGRLASNTKAVTAAAIRKLIANGQLSLHDRPIDILPPSPGMPVDGGHSGYTINDLLTHRSGLVGNVPQSGEIGSIFGLGRAATLKEMVDYSWRVPLDFDRDPVDGVDDRFDGDTENDVLYSNWGYEVLGAIIEKISGQSYMTYVQQNITHPTGATTFQLLRRGPTNIWPNELWAAGHWFSRPEWSWNDASHLPDVEDAYSMDVDMRPGAGALLSSAPDYLRFLKSYFQDGVPKPPSLLGWQWEYTFFGGGPGSLSIAREVIGTGEPATRPDGYHLAWVFITNEQPETPGRRLGDLTDSLNAYFAGVTSWPTHDFFVTGPAVNLALGRPVTSSAACTASEGPSKAVNGSVAGGSSDKWCSASASRWLQVDLGGARTIDSFTVRHAGAGGEGASRNTKAFNIQTSTDNVTWTTVVNVAANAAHVSTHPIASRSARYVRLNVTTPEQGTGTVARIYELEVYNLP